MAEEQPKKPKPKPEPKKRELKSAKRKDGIQPLKKPKKKRSKWFWAGIVAFLFVVMAVILNPPHGTINFGLCKAFVEMNDPYPASLEYVQAEEYGNLTILDYNKIDSFGQRTLNQIRCTFKDDPQKGLQLDKVDINGKASKPPQEGQDYIDRFNIGISAILNSHPNLVLPYGLPQKIKDYK